MARPAAARVVAVIASLASCLMVPAAVAADTGQPMPADGSSMGINVGQPPPNAAIRAMVPQIDILGDPMLGAADAPVTLVEFMDYECPYCQAFSRDTMPLVKKNYIDTGKLRYVARDFPLPKHGRAAPAAIAAACAREQGKFWEMHDALLASDGRLAEQDIEALGMGLDLDMARFQNCRGEERHSWRLGQDYAAARAIGVNGTPSFLVGASAGSVARGRLLQGVEDYAELERILAAYYKNDIGEEPAATGDAAGDPAPDTPGPDSPP